MSINRVVLSGNLTRDPEIRMTAGGTPVMAFGLAVNDRRKNNQTGEWEDCPNFVDCTMFGARAESVSRYINKGSKIGVEGKLRWSQWEHEGQKRSKLEVIVDEIELMQQRKDNQQAAPQPAIQPVYQPDQQQFQPVYQPQAAPQQLSAPQAPTAAQSGYCAPPQPPQAYRPYDEEIPF